MAQHSGVLDGAGRTRDLLLGSTRRQRDGFFQLRVSGSPYEMGLQHGELLKDEIRELQPHLVRTARHAELEETEMGLQHGELLKDEIRELLAAVRHHVLY